MSGPTLPPLASHVQALAFDVFGTVVDWRTSLEEELKRLAGEKIASPGFVSLPQPVQDKVKQLTPDGWAEFAAQWRSSYHSFTRGFKPGESEWRDIDAHHHESLVELLDRWHLGGLFGEDEVLELSRAWHRLRPWEDASRGIHLLGTRYTTATLSNGNTSLLSDLNDFGDLGFKRIVSAADFKAYKPHPDVYLGAARALGLRPDQVAMVAAHLGDLKTAASNGMRTIYVERPAEEEWEAEETRQAREWVDVWVTHAEGGFLEAARRLGLS